MRAALALAERGLGETWPNPSVGCIIVSAAGAVIGRGRTAPYGRPHAEQAALAAAGAEARGATAYVTLEPCAHARPAGTPPPCADALIAAGIARAVIALQDPDPRTNGAGIARLRAAGIDVRTGTLADQAGTLNAGFILRVTQARPMVTLKLASSLDGRIATAAGHSQWITGPAARQAAHRLRATHDAILVGAGTARTDNPALTCRIPGARIRPLVRIVADPSLSLSPACQLLATAREIPTWLLTTQDPSPALQATGAVFLRVASAPGGIDPAAALHALAERGITRLLLEGGGRLAASFLRAGLVDDIAWFHAPSLIGADGLPALAPLGIETLDQLARFVPVAHTPCGPDLLTTLHRARR